MASERVKFVTAFVLFVAFVNLHRSKQNLMQKYTQLDIHFARLMFKAEWINFKILRFLDKSYHFKKAKIVNLC